MDKARQAYFEKKIEDEGDKFIVFFLYDDEDQNAHVEEVEKVDFFEVVQHLNLGGSVFITHRKNLSTTSFLQRTSKSLRNHGSLTGFEQDT